MDIEAVLRPINGALGFFLAGLIVHRLVKVWSQLAPDIQLATAAYALIALVVGAGSVSAFLGWPAAPRVIATTTALTWAVVAYLMPRRHRQFTGRRRDGSRR